MNTRTTWFAIVSILIASLMTRVTMLGSVSEVVFDEVHFGKFITSYCCSHERFFDIHPPVGKLIIAGGAYLGGYTGGFSFESIGQKYGDVNFVSVRIVAAIIGSLLPAIIFVLLRQVGVSLPFSFLGALAALLDNALIVESRLIITDSILLSATFGALACAFASVQARERIPSVFWAILAGVCSGVAVGTKFTGLTGGALVGVIFLVRAYQGGYREAGTWLARAFLAGIVCCAMYLFGWMLHFSLLNLPGDGDAWGVPTGIFLQDLITTHKQMVSANYNLTADHPYGSKWWTWPFMVRSVFYWQGQESQFIYMLGNPVVWWGGFVLFCMGIISLFIHKRDRTILRSSGAWVFIFAYFLSYVPLMRVPRVLFLYHYLTPLIFSLLLAVWWLDVSVHKKNRFVWIASICIVVGYIYMSPLTYGFSLGETWQSIMFISNSWR